MASNFPLLTALRSQLDPSPQDLTAEQLLHLSKDIRQFGKEPAERVYGLIRAYSLESGGLSTISLPYDGVVLKSGPKFDLDNMPSELVHILQKFVDLHRERHTN